MLLLKETCDGITRSGRLVYVLPAFIIYMYVCSFCIFRAVGDHFQDTTSFLFLEQSNIQDPLKKYFSMQRQAGATNDNPTVLQFTKNNDTLRLIGNMWFEDAQGNCRKSKSTKQSIEDTKHLPLRKRKHRCFVSV